MPEVSLNYLAIIVATAANMVLGMLWYGPLFGKPWKRLVGMPADHKPEGAGKAMALMAGFALLESYVMAHFVDYLQATTIGDGATAGFWLWLGFVATTMAQEYIFAVKPKPWSLYAINAGFNLAALLIMGGILAVWA